MTAKMIVIQPCIVIYTGESFVLWGCPELIAISYLAGAWGLSVQKAYLRFAELAEGELSFTMTESALFSEALTWSLRKLDFTTGLRGLGMVVIFDGHMLRTIPRDKSIAQFLELYPDTHTLHVGVCSTETAGVVLSGAYSDLRFEIHPEGVPKHKVPHVHVSYAYEEGCDGSFSILTGELLTKHLKKRSRETQIRKAILEHQKELLDAWNHFNTGLSCDLNVEIGTVPLIVEADARSKAAHKARHAAKDKW